MVRNKWLNFVDILRLVYTNGVDFYTSLLLPVVVDFGNGIQLTVAGLTPSGKEINDEWFFKVSVLTVFPSMVFKVTVGNSAFAPIVNIPENIKNSKNFFIFSINMLLILTILLQR